MQQQDIMNVLLYDMSQRRAPQEIITTNNIINEVVDGWQQNKYVFPQHNIKFQHQQRKTYRLM